MWIRGRRSFAVFAALVAVTAIALADGAQPLSPEERAARTEQVRSAELAFAASVAERKADAFEALVADDAVFVGGDETTRGRAAVVASWAVFFAEGGPTIEWHPELVELTDDGTLGLSRGPWKLRAKTAKGETVEHSGVYNSIWRRQADGSWRITFDAGCAPCPVCGG